MNDAIALLAISQLVCLGAIFYLYTQFQALRRQSHGKRTLSPRAHPMHRSVEVTAPHATARAAQAAYQPSAAAVQRTHPRGEVASAAARLSDMGVDVASLARRMQKSEEEIRLLLRRRGATRP